jgi:hypothetical protein
MEYREQLAGTASSHKIIHLFLRRAEFLESLHVDQDDGK